MTIPFFSPSTPFGPFQPLHEYAIANAESISWDNWYNLFVIPLVPLYIQALLLRYEGTRYYRIAVGVVGITLLGRAVVGYRFTQPWFNALNNGIAIGVMHLIARYLEFGFIEGPLVDRYFEAKGRHPLIGAMDVAINARWIGLGAIDLDHKGKVDPGHIHLNNGNGNGNGNGHISPSKDDTDVIDGGLEFSNTHQTIPNMEEGERTKESWLLWPTVRRTRFQAVVRHGYLALRNYAIFDTALYLIRYFGRTTIGADHPVPNALYRFSHENRFIILPCLKGFVKEEHLIAPWYVVEIVTSVSVASGVWLGISSGYHLIGAILVGTGLWETESWEIDLFDSPLLADSLLDLWGRRWHQFFRHHFILYSTLILRLFHLPVNSGSTLFLSFILSGLMHSIGQFTMNPHPPLLPIFLMFPLSGMGCSLEVVFKRMTGKKVGGIYGRIWVWIAMLAVGRLGTRAWLESGVGGSYLTPPGAGEWLVKNLVEPYLIGKV